MHRRHHQLPEPVVDPALYDQAYYRTSCAGYEDWVDSRGARAAGLYRGMLDRARFRPGEVVVDLGTGRGELVAVAVQQGASRAVGFDYAADAVALAQRTLDAHGVTDRAEVRRGDLRDLPLPDGFADLVTLVDVVEHLAPSELDAALREAWRVLKPGGRVFVHTMPNRALYAVTYRAHRALMRLGGQRWPVDPRNAYELAMHVNEQTARSLRRSLRRAGFRGVRVELGRWVYTDFLPGGRHRRLYQALVRWRPTRGLAAADLFGHGRR